MLQITADVFSGRPNPSWILSDEKEARTVLRELSLNRRIVAEAAPSAAGLGFRGFLVETVSDELARDFDMPSSIYMAAGPNAASAKANELAERFIGLMTMAESAPQATDVEAVSLDESLQNFLREQFEVSGRTSVLDTEGQAVNYTGGCNGSSHGRVYV
jgi:hypothetical protein